MSKPVVLLVTVLTALPLVFSCPEIISRSDWGARKPLKVLKLKINPPPLIVVHHSATPICSTAVTCKNRVKQIQSYHIDHNGWDDIGYNFLIGGEGTVYEGRGWDIMGAHVSKFNSQSIGVCLIGNFVDQEPPQIQLDALEELIQCAKHNNYVEYNYHLIGHRQGSRTTCPGDKLFNIIKSWPNFNGTISPS